jgi:hypothetical protein
MMLSSPRKRGPSTHCAIDIRNAARHCETGITGSPLSRDDGRVVAQRKTEAQATLTTTLSFEPTASNDLRR